MRLLKSPQIFLFVFMALGTVALNAQTSLKGRVVDEQGGPIPFCDVYFTNSNEGTVTDEHGKFSLRSDKTYESITVSFVGYETEEVKIEDRHANNLKIVLKEGEQLEEVVVVAPPKKRLKKHENPAYPIMRKVWELIGRSGIEKVQAYQYKKYTSVETGINNIDTAFIRLILGYDVKVKELFATMKRNNVKKTDKFFIPLTIEEKTQNVYGNNQIGKVYVETEAERTTGVDFQGFLIDRLDITFNEVNIYKNDFQLFSRSFVSPISKQGFATYDYVLQDSLDIDGRHKEYNIYFFPRRASDMAFEGNFKVKAPLYAVTEINMRLGKGNSISLVRDLYLSKKYDIVEDKTFVERESVYEVDYTLLSKSEKEKAIYTRKSEVYEDYIFDQPKPETFYEQIKPLAGALHKGKSQKYWDSITIDYSNDLNIKYLKQVRENSKVMRTSKMVGYLTSGYFPLFGKIQFGRYWDVIGRNDIEGLRTRFGFRTFTSNDDRWANTAYVAYGFNDAKIKYGLNSRYLLSKEGRRRMVLDVSLVDDYQTSASELLNARRSLVDIPFRPRSYIFTRGNIYYLNRNFEKSVGVDVELFKNFHLATKISNHQISSADIRNFDIGFSTASILKNRFNISKVTFDVLYTPKREALGRGAIQRFPSNLPFVTAMFRYVGSYKDVFSDYTFHKVQLFYEHPLLLGALGVMKPSMQLGKTFGTAPVVLLDSAPTNQSIGINGAYYDLFSLLNFYDFVMDEYVMAGVEHDFSGFILNKIPVVRRLKYQLGVFVKGIYGTISQSNVDANRGSIVYNAPYKPYIEYGFDVHNIGFGNVRFIKVQFVWRNELPDGFVQNNKSTMTPYWGIRIGFIPQI